MRESSVMFGAKRYKTKKTKIFSSDNERKRFFAIKNYYEKKSNPSAIVIKNKKDKK